jgi:predicted HD phosphohydrolase
MDMTTPTNVTQLLELFDELGDGYFGEVITQLDHALQCGALARAAGASDELVAASLLHDVGHLVVNRQGNPDVDLDEDDDEHEAVGGRVLAALFGPAVAQPVALHVIAKRWRCTVDPAYYDTLTDCSKATLHAQGGLLDEEACRRFEAHPGFNDAVRVRDWDDEGKIPGWKVPPLQHYEAMLRSLARAQAKG